MASLRNLHSTVAVLLFDGFVLELTGNTWYLVWDMLHTWYSEGTKNHIWGITIILLNSYSSVSDNIYRLNFGQRNKASTRNFLQLKRKLLQMLSAEFTQTETFVWFVPHGVLGPSQKCKLLRDCLVPLRLHIPCNARCF